MSLLNTLPNEVDSLGQTNSAILKQVLRNKLDKTGWTREPPVILSFVNATRTFTITPTGDNFEYWIAGQKFIKSTAESVIIDDTEGIWYIYYALNILTTSQTPWVIGDGDKAFVAIVHWDATGNTAISIGYELHSHDMPSGTHNHLHHTYGTAYQNGLVLTEGAGGTVGQVGITAGEVHDEDIEINITDGAGGGLFEQVLTLPAQIPVYYRSGATAWRKYTANDYPWYDNSGADRLYYNKLNGTWASVECTNPYYVAYWIYATHDKSEPIIAIMGQREDLRLADAKDNNQIVNLSFGTLPFPEMKILYRMIWKSSTVANADDLQDLKGVSNVPGGTYVPTPTPTLSQVVAVGDTLTSGQVINSADEDLVFTFGRVSIGYDGTDADQASFAHRDFMNQTDIALRQDNTGNVRINTPDTKSLYFSVNNANTMIMSATELDLDHNILRFDTNGYIIHQRTTGGYLKIWGPDSSTDNKAIECINDGVLSVRGYHLLSLGTNEGGLNIGLEVYPTLINLKADDVDDYLQYYAAAGIPSFAVKGGSVLYFRESAAGAWETLHADDFVNETPPMPTKLCTQDILKVKSKDGQLDKDTLPEEVKFIDKNGENPGMRLGAMVLHLTKTIQEINGRIKELEKR